MQSKEWRDKKNFYQKTIEKSFSKEKPPPGANRKELVTDQDFENKKPLANEQKQK